MTSCGCRLQKLQRTGAKRNTVVSYKLWCAVCASCVYYVARILQNCGVPCREPGALFATAAAQFPTASAHWCSTAASGKFRTQVSKASAYRGPAVVRYKLRCATVPAACTLLEFYKAMVCCARKQGLRLRGQVVQCLIASAHWCSTAASGKFRTQVSKASAYRGPAVVRYKLRCATVPAACTLLEFYKAMVCCARKQGLRLRGQVVQCLIASAHWCSTAASDKFRCQPLLLLGLGFRKLRCAVSGTRRSASESFSALVLNSGQRHAPVSASLTTCLELYTTAVCRAKTVQGDAVQHCRRV